MCPFQFKNEATTQALNFFARESGGSIGKLKALKLIFLADRHHLRLCGIPITGDTYYAMHNGPIPSNAKQFAENKITDAESRNYNEKYIKTLSTGKYKSTQEIDWDALSESAKESLEWAWKTFGSMKQSELVAYTRRYPEWKKHRAKIILNPKGRILMNYLDFLKDAPTGTEPCHIMTQGWRVFMEDYIRDMQGTPNIIASTGTSKRELKKAHSQDRN